MIFSRHTLFEIDFWQFFLLCYVVSVFHINYRSLERFVLPIPKASFTSNPGLRYCGISHLEQNWQVHIKNGHLFGQIANFMPISSLIANLSNSVKATRAKIFSTQLPLVGRRKDVWLMIKILHNSQMFAVFSLSGAFSRSKNFFQSFFFFFRSPIDRISVHLESVSTLSGSHSKMM